MIVGILVINLAFSVLALVHGSSETLNSYIGCDTNIIELKSQYKDIDMYLYVVDKTLCSEECICTLTNSTGYTNMKEYNTGSTG